MPQSLLTMALFKDRKSKIDALTFKQGQQRKNNTLRICVLQFLLTLVKGTILKGTIPQLIIEISIF